MRHYLFVVAAAMVATGCGTMQNTPAQDLAYERVQTCQGVSQNVILQRIESDGRVWVEMRNGTVGYDEWRQCMAKAEQDQAATRAKR
jgi:ligand-binding sensor domain-containing protein